jgi:hypothetical protein
MRGKNNGQMTSASIPFGTVVAMIEIGDPRRLPSSSSGLCPTEMPPYSS